MCGCRFSFNAVAPEWSDQGLSRETTCPVPGMLNLARDAHILVQRPTGVQPKSVMCPRDSKDRRCRLRCNLLLGEEGSRANAAFLHEPKRARKLHWHEESRGP